MAGVALGDMDRHFAWQAWHLVTSMRTLLGRRGTYGTGLALVARLGPVDAWQAWTFALHGRRGAWRHGPSLCVAGVARGDIDVTLRGVALGDISLCVAGVALGDIDVHFAWQAWHLWHWNGSGGALGSQLTPWTPWLFAWHAWHLATSTFTGRRRTWPH